MANTMSSLIALGDVFDPDVAPVWITQVSALDLFASRWPQGVHSAEVREIYRVSAKFFPEIFEGSTYESWLQFLEENELVERKAEWVIAKPGCFQFMRELQRSGALAGTAFGIEHPRMALLSRSP